MSNIPKLEDLTPAQIRKLSDKELREAATRLNHLANSRIRRLEKKEVNSPAYRNAMKSGGRFSIRYKDREEVLQEVARAKRFVSSKTSTIGGNIKTAPEKRHTNKYDTNTLKNLSFEQLRKLDNETLYNVGKQLRDIANKRYKALGESEFKNASAYHSFEKSGGKIHITKDMTQPQLRREIARALKFLNQRSSTITGAKEIQREMSERIGEQTKEWDVKKWSAFWKAYHAVTGHEKVKSTANRAGSPPMLVMMSFMYENGKSESEMVDYIVENSDNIIAELEAEKLESVGLNDEQKSLWDSVTGG